MSKLRAFPPSPLARHPGLLWRKVASRLDWYREDAPVPSPGNVRAAYPEHWVQTLRGWMRQVPLAPAPHPFNLVFGHAFDESLLRQLCRDGPLVDERGLTGDIKLVWDYSRGHALFTNAAAGPANVGVCAAFLRRWLESNHDTNGPAWSCAMDTAIRAVNWVFADVLFEGALANEFGRTEFHSWLWRHGWSIWRRLEARIVSSNHYLANLMGLAAIGSIFPDDTAGRRWWSFARSEFPRALLAQTRADGGLNEASLRYHAFVTEMALLCRLTLGAPWPTAAEHRLREMCQIVADFKDTSGDVFPIGDDDSGRVLAVDGASPLGRAEILLRLAGTVLDLEFQTSRGKVCRDSGWWIRRAGEFAVALDFGGVGLNGLGGHAHNDDFSICLEWRNHPVIIDPGTFLYTTDAEARNRFRSVLSHNTLVIDGREPRALTSGIFAMPGPDTAFQGRAVSDDAWRFLRRVDPGLAHQREVRVTADGVCVTDLVEGPGRRRLEWRFHLHPAIQARAVSNGFLLDVQEGRRLLLEANGLAPAFRLDASDYSPGYGQKQPATACVASGEFSLPISVEWRLQAAT